MAVLSADGLPAAPSMAGPVSGDVIKESSTEGFMADVIEASAVQPVIVDFWAPWCGPCKTLGPTIERLVRQAGGLVKLVKINVDENQDLAQQMKIQSIPAVYAFVGGRPVDGFAGALPESQIKAFIDKLLGGAKPPLEQALEQAAAMLDAGDAAGAGEIYGAILAQEPANAAAIAGILRCYLAVGETEAAKQVIAGLPADLKRNQDVAAAITALELIEQGTDSGELSELAALVAAEPGNHQARFDLATALFAAGRNQDAVDGLLELIRLDRAWNDEAARLQLIKVFGAIGHTHPVTVEGRRRLSKVLFA